VEIKKILKFWAFCFLMISFMVGIKEHHNYESIIKKQKEEISYQADRLKILKSKILMLEKQIERNHSKKLIVTAYTSSMRETDSTPGITAFNKLVSLRTVAVSRDLYQQGWHPGLIVDIEGVGFYKIADKMNKDKYESIDIYVKNVAEANAIGRTKRSVVLLQSY